jgi:hypothetical protein
MFSLPIERWKRRVATRKRGRGWLTILGDRELVRRF